SIEILRQNDSEGVPGVPASADRENWSSTVGPFRPRGRVACLVHRLTLTQFPLCNTPARRSTVRFSTAARPVERGESIMRDDLDEITQVIRHHWDRRANSFDEETGHGLVSDGQRVAWLDLLSELVGPPPQLVLDVGCGTGFLALRLAELGHIVAGIDLAPKMI